MKVGFVCLNFNFYFYIDNGVNANDAPFDWLVFLGGTNDLAYSKTAEEIWEAISAVISIPMVRDYAKVLLCTVPECGVKHERLDGKREELNEKIRSEERNGL